MATKCILGSRGFLGSALAKKLGDYSWYPTEDTKVIFHFDSPVHPPYEESPDFFLNRILNDFLYLLPYCQRNGIKFVYASSALVYEKDTNFSRQKKILELMASMYPNTLGLRIFPVYGPGEDRTVITQWCKGMKKGEQPVIYGNGQQRRDFIYIDDAVNQIISLSENTSGIVDVGSGKPVKFRKIVETINSVLKTDIKPIFVKEPEGYSMGIICHSPLGTQTNLEHGIRKILGREI